MPELKNLVIWSIKHVQSGSKEKPDMNRNSLISLAILVVAGCTYNGVQMPSASSQPIYGIGYAVISSQKGNSAEEKRLMAVKASKLEAYKSLVEQLYGQYIEVQAGMTNSVVDEEVFRSRVEGLISGATVVSVKPIGDHTYETTLRLGSNAAGELTEAAE